MSEFTATAVVVGNIVEVTPYDERGPFSTAFVKLDELDAFVDRLMLEGVIGGFPPQFVTAILDALRDAGLNA
jgi:hypothetical protein